MHGHLVIADISGYTRLLTESDLGAQLQTLADMADATFAEIAPA